MVLYYLQVKISILQSKKKESIMTPPGKSSMYLYLVYCIKMINFPPQWLGTRIQYGLIMMLMMIINTYWGLGIPRDFSEPFRYKYNSPNNTIKYYYYPQVSCKETEANRLNYHEHTTTNWQGCFRYIYVFPFFSSFLFFIFGIMNAKLHEQYYGY